MSEEGKSIRFREANAFEVYAFYKVFQSLHQEYFAGQMSVAKFTEAAAFSIPYMVNGTFACEVALKAYIEISDAKKAGHNLEALYHCLPKEPKEAIKKAFMEYGLTDAEFDATLAESLDLYKKWRYFFDPAQGNLLAPEHFCKLVDAICLTTMAYSQRLALSCEMPDFD